MSRSRHDGNKLVAHRRELVEWFEKGAVAPGALLIGVEHEKPPFYLSGNAPVPYSNPPGGAPAICDLLEKLAAEKGWSRGYEGQNLVELQRGAVTWTLEPGGQMETGGAPLKTIHAIARETDAVLGEAVAAGRALGIGLLAAGYHPSLSAAQMPFMPKSRYHCLRALAQQKNYGAALDMMTCTASAQVNFGYTSEDDMVKKLRVALSLQPVAVALFANSPFKDGKPSGYQSYRSHMIEGQWGGRYGFMLPLAFEDGFGFEKFVNYALDTMPMMGIYKDDVFYDTHGGMFRAFMDGNLAAAPGRHATMDDWANHLNTIWPEVRVRRVLEMRGADNGPQEMVDALAAFWTGILYDPATLDDAWQMVRHWTDADRDYLRHEAPKAGLQTPFMGGTVQDLAKDALALSEQGLKRRSVTDAYGRDESVYLEPLREIAASGLNWSQRLLDRYHNVWNGDISRLYAEMNYENSPSVLKPAPRPASAGKKAFVPRARGRFRP